MRSERVVVVGAGPCGLGCARELVALGCDDFLVLEASDHPGGLAASVVDDAGFTWDRGGHVVFSHYGEFDRLLTEVMGEDVCRHERSSFVRLAGTWVPYPLQKNLHQLPPDIASEALIGLVAAQTGRHPAPPAGQPLDFGSWMLATFGEGIVRHFMRPYNEKVWAYPPSRLSARWMAERVATVDWQQAVRSFVAGRDDVAWGPNNLFAFPTSGGTGSIYRRAARDLSGHIEYDAMVTGVDAGAHEVQLADGRRVRYESLLWTGPLDQLVGALSDAPTDVSRAAGDLVHNSVTVLGIGYHAPLRDERSWFYFPEPDVPFYRATNFAKYAAANVPGGRTDQYCSWMTEIASSAHQPCPDGDLGARVDTALREVGLVDDGTAIASVHTDHLAYGYPVPTVERDAALRVIQPWLMHQSILARGRFGAWLYELGNMDHAVKMGVDAARHIVAGVPEQAWHL